MRKIFNYLIDLGLLKIVPDKLYVKIQYRKRMKKKLNLDNPKSFNEKLQWLKLYDRKDIYTMMADKYEVKKYVSNLIGSRYVISTLGVWNKFNEIDFNKLPNQFVLKCTHDSGGIYICKDKTKMNYRKIKLRFDLIMKRNFYYRAREWPYKNIKPRIIAEPYLEDDNYHELRDYKFYVFNNKVVLSFICSDRKNNLKYTFFDRNGNYLDIKQCGRESDSNVKLPINYYKMIELSEKLSIGLKQIRVDFYEINKKIYFGELTFFDDAGYGKFDPEEWDEKLGSFLDLGFNEVKR